MKEESVNIIFRAFKKELISRLGNKALYDDEIDKVGKQLFKQWRGVNSQDKIVYKPGYQIINIDTSKMKGSHWVALYIKGKNIYVYDSFGRETNTLLKILTKQAKAKKFKIINADLDPEQRNTSEVCGPLSLAWLLTVKHFGITNAMKI